MLEWIDIVEVMVIVAILMFVSIMILEWKRRREWKHEYGWYRRGSDGVNAKAHYFRFGGESVPSVSFVRYYSLCKGKYLDPLGNWERIEDPSLDVMCTKCMDLLVRKRSQRRGELKGVGDARDLDDHSHVIKKS